MKNKVAIEKMIKYIDKTMIYCKGQNYDSFESNEMLIEACVFDISQIGELCRHLDEDFMKKYSEIPWHKMRGLRNRIIHDYDGLNLLPVWETINDDFPELKTMLLAISRELESTEQS